MSKGYENFLSTITELGITPYRISKATGLTNVLFVDWKKGKSIPKHDKMKLIAEYLGVTTDYLYGISELKENIANTLDNQIESIDFALSGEIRKLNDFEKQDILDYVRFKLQNRED